MSIFNGQIGNIWGERDRYKGQSCYVIGDGPSVKWFDFSKFTDRPVICCNMFPLHRQFDELDVKACIMLAPLYFAPRFLRKRHDYLINSEELSRGYKEMVLMKKNISFVFHYSNMPFINYENSNFIGKTANFSNKSLRKLDWFGGGFYASLGLAIYLGFSKISFIGHDAWLLQPSHEGHWYERGMNEQININDPLKQRLESIDLGVEINAIGINHYGKSIPVVSYSDFTGLEPVYQENIDLLSDINMSLLKTNPDINV